MTYNSPAKPLSTTPSPTRSRLDPHYAARLYLKSPTRTSSYNSNQSWTPSPTRRRHQHGGVTGTPNSSQSPNRDYGGGNNNSTVIYSDRFIPSRSASHLENFENINVSACSPPLDRSGANTTGSLGDDHAGSTTNLDGVNGAASTSGQQQGQNDSNAASNDSGGGGGGRLSHQPLMNLLLRSELLGENQHQHHGQYYPNAQRHAGSFLEPISPNRRAFGSSSPQRNAFKFQTPRHGHNSMSNSIVKPFNLSPPSERSMISPQQRKRRIAKVPFKVLDAPALQDDFYLNLVDWSSLNVLAVGLGSCVYLWSACTSKVTKLCDLACNDDSVTSVSWTERGTHLAVGTNKGEVQIWDTAKCNKVRTMTGHSARVGTLSWNGPSLASGSRDRLIYLRDVRVQQPYTATLACHKQEVCGLKWSFDEPAHLASGGNDNKLLVWDIKNHTRPAHRFAEHNAAVKAIAWSPHQHGLLASGGGTADRCIRFWNTLSGSSLSCIDTGSQVCNLAWSKNCNEIVSTHGYSLNQIVVWRYPSMSKVATLTGHTYRVLYLALSPDGSTIVTGAGDETLRFWQIFPGPRSHEKNAGTGLLFPHTPGSVIR
uniref:CDC20/Fizzy WD40 domain-containing protein n=1 Tax=Leptocylindrus danicus TaxID=163516 RepID=A0A7S2JUQ3_9STRA|mmetsp:Transcript_11982/g.18078  ORF Transcript_11982/g.18078 Transcript_11982/m.18078 type:complete len:596 (+) Transcript_11982:877-2664(+)|eukprot:CAMPEP_0116011446 /NCGR_PEP_ID=MMETSP0321-20121206/4573_1 /TAXON_ID=163516 /ORGANISM="Leptocylindrus danicus var. danicus, Strain B650" /LENGTH=595 /DNA_ID=CAMNT_0003480681 /DNA_START=857 /DNA_END=2644 /DNA_ORIENTATION=+